MEKEDGKFFHLEGYDFKINEINSRDHPVI